MAGVTLADVYSAYVKPSLDGRLVIRKRTSRQTSARLEKAKERVKKAKPSEKAHARLVREGKCPTKRVYEAGKGYVEKPVCPIDQMRSALREEMEKAHGVLKKVA